MRNRSLFLIALLAALAAASCSSGPAPPRPGTPGFYWAAAKEAYRGGDYPKTVQNLSDVASTDNEFATRARAWHIVVAAGMAQAYSELAENNEAGARANRNNPMPFHKQVSNLNSMASAAALDLAEAAHAFLAKDKDAAVLLALEFPGGSATAPGSLKRVADGILIQDSERESLQLAMLQRGVLLSVCRATGNGDNVAKTSDQFKAGEVRVPREVFLLASAKALSEQVDLFGPKKLDQPARLHVVADQALENLKEVPETKETKALVAKLQAALKRNRT
jgi:hypothetical protein